MGSFGRVEIEVPRARLNTPNVCMLAQGVLPQQTCGAGCADYYNWQFVVMLHLPLLILQLV
jgi:hypothetical protein